MESSRRRNNDHYMHGNNNNNSINRIGTGGTSRKGRKMIALLWTYLRWILTVAASVISWSSNCCSEFLSHYYHVARSFLDGSAAVGGMGTVVTLEANIGEGGGGGVDDHPLRVRLGKKIAEGGFSYVYEARLLPDANDGKRRRILETMGHGRYAVKRMNCADEETLREYEKEIHVHKTVGNHHENLMPLLGCSNRPNHSNTSDGARYMLFPLLEHSLRKEIDRRIWSPPPTPSSSCQGQDHAPTPWQDEEWRAVEIMKGIAAGISALHQRDLTHRDLKLDNVLLRGIPSRTQTPNTGCGGYVPVVMDYGSCGPSKRSAANRREIMRIVEDAAVHTTISYRPPELFDNGMIRPPPPPPQRGIGGGGGGDHGAGEDDDAVDDDGTFDYRMADVWGMGCTFFAILFGASPYECEFVHNGNGGRTVFPSSNAAAAAAKKKKDGGGGGLGHGYVKIAECNQLRVLGPVPEPASDSPLNEWYYPDDPRIKRLVLRMLDQDRRRRPTVRQVIDILDSVLLEQRKQPHARQQQRQQRQQKRQHHHGQYRDLDPRNAVTTGGNFVAFREQHEGHGGNGVRNDTAFVGDILDDDVDVDDNYHDGDDDEFGDFEGVSLISGRV